MPKIIEAIYENGVFKPLQKVDLKEGEKVRIRIDDVESIINEFYGILESDISLDEIKKARYEAKTWRGF